MKSGEKYRKESYIYIYIYKYKIFPYPFTPSENRTVIVIVITYPPKRDISSGKVWRLQIKSVTL